MKYCLLFWELSHNHANCMILHELHGLQDTLHELHGLHEKISNCMCSGKYSHPLAILWALHFSDSLDSMNENDCARYAQHVSIFIS